MADRKGRSITFKVPHAMSLRDLKTGLESGIFRTLWCFKIWEEESIWWNFQVQMMQKR